MKQNKAAKIEKERKIKANDIVTQKKEFTVTHIFTAVAEIYDKISLKQSICQWKSIDEKWDFCCCSFGS